MNNSIKKKTSLLRFAACVTAAALLLSFAACGKEEAKSNKKTGITIHGEITDPKGVAPVGYEVVFCTADDRLYVGKVGEDGSFEVNGLLPDTEHSLTVEDKDYNRYTETSFFTMTTADEVALVNGGKNMYSYLNVNVTETTQEVYITFCLNTQTGYIECKYISTEGPQPAEAYTSNASTAVQTTESGVLF